MREEIHQEVEYSGGKATWYVIDKNGNKNEFKSWDYMNDEISNYIGETISKKIDEEIVKSIIDNMQSNIDNISSVIQFRDMNEHEKELYRRMLSKDEVIKENVF